jgi:NitT/TauT family transport system ATP-binding protein
MLAPLPDAVRLEGVSKVYEAPGRPPSTVIDALDLHIRPGEFVSLVGPSGCGKSTVLKLVSGLLPVTRGRIVVMGEPVVGPPRGVGFMFQRDTLLPWISVAGNIEIALELNGTPKTDWPGRIAEILKLLGLSAYADYKPAALSGGMRQRVSLGRLLAYAPHIYLMDEPFGALDAMTKMRMGRELLRIWSGSGKSVIFVTHDIEEAVGLSDRVVVMRGPNGRIQAEFEVPLERPRDLRQLRLDPAFRDLCERIWQEIGLEAVDEGAPV